MTAQLTVELTPVRDAGRRSDPLRSTRDGIRAKNQQPTAFTTTDVVSAAARQSAQLPGFAPLLEELEVAGWSSHRRALSGNFHDWMLLQGRTLLVMAGHATGAEATDPIEAALVAQGAWAAIRSHAHHATDAGMLLSLTARTLWPIANAGVKASIAIALVDLDGGHASVAAAGDCLTMRVRATGSEPIVANQPAIGTDGEYTYPSETLQLSVRERILLVADEPARRAPKLSSKITTLFSRLDAEAHRRMMAADAVDIVREFYELQAGDETWPSASIVAVRRR